MKSNFSANNDTQLNVFSEEAYITIGSTWFSDGFYLFMVLPWTIINVFLNGITFLVINKMTVKPSTKKLYVYLKIYVLVCGLLSLVGTTMFITFSPRYMPFGLNFFARLWRCQVKTPILLLLHFYTYILDILIIIERLSQFSSESSRIFIRKYSPYKLSVIALIFCVIVNMPINFWYDIGSDEKFFQEAREKPDKITYCSLAEFITSPIGSILSIIMLTISDILTLILEMILNIVLIFFYVKFLKKKSQVVSHQNGTTTRTNHKLFSSSEINLFLMIIFLSLISFTSHTCTAFSTFYLLGFKSDGVSLSTNMLITSFISTFKYFSNFFVLIIFNNKFRNEFNVFFSKSVNRNVANE